MRKNVFIFLYFTLKISFLFLSRAQFLIGLVRKHARTPATDFYLTQMRTKNMTENKSLYTYKHTKFHITQLKVIFKWQQKMNLNSDY